MGLKGRSFSGSVVSKLKLGSGSISVYAEKMGTSFVGGKVASIFKCIRQLGTSSHIRKAACNGNEG